MVFVNKKNVVIDESKYNRNYKLEKSIEDYIEHVNLRNGGSKNQITKIKYNTYARKKSDLKKFLNFIHKKHSKVQYTLQINNYIVSEYVNYLCELKKKNGGEYSTNSRYAYFASFKSYINYLAKLNAIKKETYSYIENIDTFNFSHKTNQMIRETGYLTPQQISKMYDNIDKHYKDKMSLLRNQAIFLLLLHGFRRNEIIILKWDDIDFENCTVRITRTKTTKKNTVYINKDTVDKLKKYRETLTDEFKHKNAYVFAGREEKTSKNFVPFCHISENAVRDIVIKISEDEKDSFGKEITCRTFRKTFTVSNMRVDNKLALIQNYTQHSLNVLQNNYMINFKNSDLEAEDSIEKYFDYIFNRENKSIISDLKVEDIIKNEALNEKLKEHYFKEFYNQINLLKTSI